MESGVQSAIAKDRVSRRSAARSAILEAARRLALRDGSLDISLTAVAAEAGFGPSTVFGHFRNKDELVLAVIAEDLGWIASRMRGAFPEEADLPQSFDSGEAIRPVLVERAATEAARNAELYETEFEENSSGSKPPVSSFAAEVPEGGDWDTGKSEPATEDGAKPGRLRVDAWLERRLRVFEHTLSGIERRLGEAERGTMRAVSLSEDGMKMLGERFDAFESRHTGALQYFSARLDEGEQRLRGVTAEFRALVNDAAGRIERLESFSHAPTEPYAIPAAELSGEAEETAATPEPETLAEAPPVAEVADANSRPAASEADSYLAAARRAASAAAMLANMQDRRPNGRSIWQKVACSRIRLNRKHYIIALCAAAFAFAAGASAAFYAGIARGREQAPAAARKIAVIAPRTSASHVSGKAAYRTPLDRLSALANAGNPQAELFIGLKYLHGDGIPPNPGRAAQWIRRSAEQRNVLAEYWMGLLYDRGEGVEADPAAAVRWYKSAAERGNRKAMHALGIAYAEGKGILRDYTQAARWFTKAAQLGFVNSEFNLAVLHERGEGVPQSLADAYKWYEIAARQGDGESRARTDALKTQLNPSELAAADEAATEFHAQDADRSVNNAPVLAEVLKGSGKR